MRVIESNQDTFYQVARKKSYSPITCKVEYSGCCLGLTIASTQSGEQINPANEVSNPFGRKAQAQGNKEVFTPFLVLFSPIYPVLYVHSRGLQCTSSSAVPVGDGGCIHQRKAHLKTNKTSNAFL